MITDDGHRKQSVVGDDGEDVSYVGSIVHEESSLYLPHRLEGGGVDESHEEEAEESCTR